MMQMNDSLRVRYAYDYSGNNIYHTASNFTIVTGVVSSLFLVDFASKIYQQVMTQANG